MRTLKNALSNLVQTVILNFKMATKIRFLALFRSPRLKRLDCDLYTHILRVKESNENNNKCIGQFSSDNYLEFQNGHTKYGYSPYLSLRGSQILDFPLYTHLFLKK